MITMPGAPTPPKASTAAETAIPAVTGVAVWTFIVQYIPAVIPASTERFGLPHATRVALAVLAVVIGGLVADRAEAGTVAAHHQSAWKSLSRA